MASALKVVAGNTAPQYQITCERTDGTIIDLTNCTVAMYLYKNKVQVNTGHETSTITIITPTKGLIGWQPASGDFASAGQYKGNIQITYADGSIEVLYNQALFSARNLVQ